MPTTKTDSQSVPHVYAAIAEVMGDLSKYGIEKNNKNQQQGYNFRGIDDIYNALSTFLTARKLVIIPRVKSRTTQQVPTKAGGVLNYSYVDVEYDLVSAIDGSSHTACTCGEAMDSADKSGNKALSAAYKYLALQLFCIPTEGDNDADATTHQPAAPEKPKPLPPVDPKPAENPTGSVQGGQTTPGKQNGGQQINQDKQQAQLTTTEEASIYVKSFLTPAQFKEFAKEVGQSEWVTFALEAKSHAVETFVKLMQCAKEGFSTKELEGGELAKAAAEVFGN